MPFDGKNLNELQQVVLRAQDLLRRDGWTQGSYINLSGTRCLVGAILWANHRHQMDADSLSIHSPVLSAALFHEAKARGALEHWPAYNNEACGAALAIGYNDKFAKDLEDALSFLDGVLTRL